MSIIFHIVYFRTLMFLLPYLYHVGEGHCKLRTVGVECWQHTIGEEWLRTIGVEYLAHTRTLALHISQLSEDVGNHGVAADGWNAVNIHILNDMTFGH